MKEVKAEDFPDALREMAVTGRPFIVVTKSGQKAIVRPIDGDDPVGSEPRSPELAATP